MTGWSSHRQHSSDYASSELETFSEKMARLFPGYCLDGQMRIRPLPETRTLSLAWLKELLVSTDASLFEANQWLFENGAFFLDEATESQTQEKVALASFPRSGNTFLRKYVELLTGLQTGGDNPLHFNVNFQMLGAKGE